MHTDTIVPIEAMARGSMKVFYRPFYLRVILSNMTRNVVMRLHEGFLMVQAGMLPAKVNGVPYAS